MEERDDIKVGLLQFVGKENICSIMLYCGVALVYFSGVLLVLTLAGPVVPFAGSIASVNSDSEVIEPPKPYAFGFKMDDGNGTVQHRQETANEKGAIKGTYGYLDPNGMYREVEYQADENGYQAKIRSNEPGMTNQNSADVYYVVKPNQSQ